MINRVPSNDNSNMITIRGAQKQKKNKALGKNIKSESIVQISMTEHKEQSIALNSRKDVLLKSLLRSIRRYYLRIFQEITGFDSLSRKKNTKLYKQNIETFVETLLPQLINSQGAINKTIQHIEVLQKSLIFIFGSIFYPKLLLME